jgi:Flp pilus assembly protein TadB
MTMALAWLAGAIWLCGRRRDAPDGGEVRASGDDSAGDRAVRIASRHLIGARWLRVIASAAAVAAPVAVFGVPVGVVTGLLAAPLAHITVIRLQAVDDRRVDAGARQAVPLTVDLLAAVLRSGQPLVAALDVVMPLAGPRLRSELSQVVGLLRLGADPVIAWRDLADHALLARVARTAVRSAQSGIRLAGGFEQLASELRAEQRATATVRAHRAGVWTMAPLGLCFLPAFVCLGIVPVVVGIARDAYPGLSG